MVYESEVTVEVNISLDELVKIIEKNNFKLKEVYDLNDIYLIDSRNKSDNYLDMLGKCVLIRHIIEENKDTKMLTYKYKEYNDKQEITKQGKVKVNIDDIDKSKELFERLGFETLIKLNDHLLVYANEEDEFAIQCVNDKHIYIEIEDECNYIDKKYSSIDEMKNVFSKYNIPIIANNYFAKKALIELEETENETK